MNRNLYLVSFGALLAAVTVGCSNLKSDDPLPQPTLSGDAHLTILQTTDVHHQAQGQGHVSATAPAANGSYARISAYVNYVRGTATNPVVLVDSGDWSMGTLYDLSLGSQPTALFYMDALKYNCATLGNHEFDYTPAGLATILKAAKDSFSLRTPLVASNINLNGNTDLAPYVGVGKTVLPYKTEVLSNGLKVGYIGLMGKDATGAAPAAAPVTFTDFSANYASVQTMVDQLRNSQGCHVVIALSHTGTDATGTSGEDVNLAKHVKGIDVIASGHMHNPLSSAVPYTYDGWTTQIICAGAYGNNVSRIDLTFHASAKNTTLDASSNPIMNAATMTSVGCPLPTGDPALSFIVGSVDAKLNQGLAPLFTQLFPSDYNSSDISTGLYHTVGSTVQDMISNDKNPVLCPNGMGNLCVDAVRNVPNALLAHAPAGADTTPYTLGVVATGVIRGNLTAGVPLSFADVYNVLPLGTSPDLTQSIPVGYPLMSAYLELADIKKICALQLVSQTNLTPSDFYLNLSGIRYTLKTTESGTYFKYATAAAVLNVTSKKAAAGSANAIAALTATPSQLVTLAMAGTNPYAKAMVQLNDPAIPADPTTNLQTLAEIATSSNVSALIVGKAVLAIDTVSAFAPTDSACTGSPTAMGVIRYRVAADLYAIMMMGAAQAQFGTAITAYSGATGSGTVSAANLTAAMANRINAAPTSSTVVELKEWMALLNYIGSMPGYQVPSAYASTADFSGFGSFGAAVTVRNASYPIASIGPLMVTLNMLLAAS